MCVAAVWVCYARRPFKKYRVLGRFWRADWAVMRQLIVIGVPISGAMLLEWGLFSSAAMLMGWIGTTALAAHQIALQIAAILFMVPFGISMAATVRVGHAVGREDPVATRRAGFAAMALGAVIMVAMTLLVVALRNVIPLLFLRRRGRGDARDGASCRRAAACLARPGSSSTACRELRQARCGASTTPACRCFMPRSSFWIVGFTQRLCARVLVGPRRGRHLDRLCVGPVRCLRSAADRCDFTDLTARGFLPAIS